MNIESYKKCSSAISLQGREKSVRKSSIRAVRESSIRAHSLGVNQASPTKLGHSYLYVKGSDGNNQLFLIVTGRAFNNQSSTNDFGSYVYKPADLLNGLEAEVTVPPKNFDIPNDIPQLNTTYYQRERVDIHQLKDEIKSVTSYIDDNGLDYE
ncbi:hypothetical protein HAU13_08425 [Weissella confusa]|uniref:hypothetical protein n=1 Tax=Weissella confusa TaxID=1583 RepID=UPI0018F17185|nr:hypothetical protein [Weissella confusa]MBJ7622766.1 hypothetical protein [Weissella confusa]